MPSKHLDLSLELKIGCEEEPRNGTVFDRYVGSKIIGMFFLTCVHVDESDPVQKISLQEESKTGWA